MARFLQAIHAEAEKCTQRFQVVSDALFDFDKATLTPSAEETLDALGQAASGGSQRQARRQRRPGRAAEEPARRGRARYLQAGGLRPPATTARRAVRACGSRGSSRRAVRLPPPAPRWPP